MAQAPRRPFRDSEHARRSTAARPKCVHDASHRLRGSRPPRGPDPLARPASDLRSGFAAAGRDSSTRPLGASPSAWWSHPLGTNPSRHPSAQQRQDHGSATLRPRSGRIRRGARRSRSPATTNPPTVVGTLVRRMSAAQRRSGTHAKERAMTTNGPTLRVDAATVYRSIRANAFPAVRIRSRYVVPESASVEIATEAAESGGCIDLARRTHSVHHHRAARRRRSPSAPLPGRLGPVSPGIRRPGGCWPRPVPRRCGATVVPPHDACAVRQRARNARTTGTNLSWNWKMPPCPASG